MERKKSGSVIIDDVLKCPECESPYLVDDRERGEKSCKDCGYVVEENMIDSGRDWRAYDKEGSDRRAHTGAPMDIRIHDKGLPTEIGRRSEFKDARGMSIPDYNRRKIYSLRKWQRRIRVNSATERNLIYAMQELERLASQMDLPKDVREAAAMIYRKAVSKDMIRGRSIEGVVASSLYGGCRQCDVPRTLDEVADASGRGRREIGRTYRDMSRKLKFNLTPTNPHDYIGRFCSGLKLSNRVQTKAAEIIRQAEEKELIYGRGPAGTAAAAIYRASILCNEYRTQQEIANEAGVTEVTVRNRCREMREKLDIEV